MYNQVDSNRRQTLYMFFIFSILVIAIGWIFSYVFESPLILYIAVAIAVVQSWVSYYHSDKIALAVTGAKPAEEATHKELHRIVENLAITAGIPKPRLYLINDSSPNAFATGRNPQNAAVAVTTGLLDTLDRSELEGVIAHEIAHITNRDILVMTVAVTLVGTIALATDIFLRSWFWSSAGRSNDSRNNGYFILIAIALAILAPIFAKLIQLAVSRKREYMADASGALLTRYPEGLASALEKISNYAKPMKSANRATAHLFINEPFGKKDAKKQSWFMTAFSTHPPAADRIRRLREMA